MKVVVLSSHTPSLFWFRTDMMLAFIKAGCEVVAAGNEPEEAWAEKFADLGVKYRRIDVQRNGTNPLKDLKTLKSIHALLKEEKPDKIFCYQAKTVIYGCLAARMLKIRDVFPLIAGLGSVFLTNGLKASVVRQILVTEYRLALKYAKKVFFQNRDDSGVFIKHKIVSPSDIVYISGSGVNTEKFNVTELPEIPAFLNISRLIKDKGIREYLDACRIVKKEHPEYRCLLVGPYDSNPTAITEQELSEYINDGTVEYFGEQSDVKPYLAQASIYVLPSYHEGTPKTVLEAMACGRAVITTDAPGCRETVIGNANGILVEPKNHTILAQKMLELASDPELVHEMGKAGRKLAEEKFSVVKVNETILSTMGI